MRRRVVVYRVFFHYPRPHHAKSSQFTTRDKGEAERVAADHADYHPVIRRRFMARSRAAARVREGWMSLDESVRARGWY